MEPTKSKRIRMQLDIDLYTDEESDRLDDISKLAQSHTMKYALMTAISTCQRITSFTVSGFHVSLKAIPKKRVLGPNQVKLSDAGVREKEYVNWLFDHATFMPRLLRDVVANTTYDAADDSITVYPDATSSTGRCFRIIGTPGAFSLQEVL